LKARRKAFLLGKKKTAVYGLDDPGYLTFLTEKDII
jgi:hypothetical protein